MDTIKAYTTAFTCQDTFEIGSKMIGRFGGIEWLSVFLVLFSLIILIFCLALSAFIWNRNRKHLRTVSKNKDLNRYHHHHGPKESFINWRKVSGPGSKRNDTSHSSGTIDSNHEFEYLSFDTPDSSLNLRTSDSNSSSRHKRRLLSLGVQKNQSRLHLAKEKVIQIGPIVDSPLSTSPLPTLMDSNRRYNYNNSAPNNQHPKRVTTYITTKEEIIGSREKLNKDDVIRSSHHLPASLHHHQRGADNITVNCLDNDDDNNDNSVPQPYVSVQMNEQTESIIKAIRSELKKFHPSSESNNFRENNSSDA